MTTVMQTPGEPTSAPTPSTLVAQVQARRDELTRGLTATANGASTRADIEGALASLTPMLTGDLTNIPEMVSRDLARWLDASKYLGLNAATPVVEGASPAPTVKTEEVAPAAIGPTVLPPTPSIPG